MYATQVLSVLRPALVGWQTMPGIKSVPVFRNMNIAQHCGKENACGMSVAGNV